MNPTTSRLRKPNEAFESPAKDPHGRAGQDATGPAHAEGHWKSAFEGTAGCRSLGWGFWGFGIQHLRFSN